MRDREGNRFLELLIRVSVAVVLLTIAILIPNFLDSSSSTGEPAEEKSVEGNMEEGKPGREKPGQEKPEQEKTEQDESDKSGQEPEKEISRQVEEKLSSMSLSEKIYQMFIVTPEALCGYQTVTAATDTTKDALLRHPVGGIIYFEKNLIDAGQTEEMLRNTQEYAKEIEGVPLFLCVDEEGGKVARIGGRDSFGTEAIEAMQDVTGRDRAYEIGDTMGAYLSGLGFNFDFAPDADVLTNPSNQVIGSRSFGSDADVVTELSLAVSRGLQDNGVLSAFKHFPGHGATEADSHDGLAYTDKTYEQLLEAELKPFQAAGAGGVDAVMAAHISVPEILGDNTPCSLSKHMITDILREEFGFQGLIVTDALDMGAIVNTYGADSAAVLAVQAGNDLLLMPQNLESAVEGIQEAIASGELTEEMIDDRVRRILYTKYEKIAFKSRGKME